MSCLDLVVPELFGPVSVKQGEGAAQPRTPLLATLLGRADRAPFPGDDLIPVVWRLFGGAENAHRDIPVAAIARLVESDRTVDGFWIYADPVVLQPDRDRLLLYDVEGLEFELPEALQLADLFNQHYRDRGWCVQVFEPKRWYLKLPSAPRVVTHPTWAAVGRNIDSLLPGGAQARDWHFVLNEVQMLFHTASVNQRRSNRGLPPINGLWFWGGGECPDGMSAGYERIYSSMPFMRGLAQITGGSAQPLPPAIGEVLDRPIAGNCVVIYEELQRPILNADLASWQTEVERLERDWVEPMWRALKRGLLTQIRVFPCDGSVYHIDKRCRLRIWRRAKTLL